MTLSQVYHATGQKTGGGAWKFLRFSQDKLTRTSLHCLSFRDEAASCSGGGAWESNPPGTPCRAPHWI